MNKRHQHEAAAAAPEASSNGRPGEPPRALTPPQLAARWGVSSDKVLHLIRTGQLRALNVAADPGGRPRWRIPVEAVLAFEQARAAGAPAPSGRQRRRAAVGDVIPFF
jgi:hypothetical protein